MDYEKAYKEALERARQAKNGEGDWRYYDSYEIIPALEEIFPELACEDEEIREDLIGGLMWQRDNLDRLGKHDDSLILPGFCCTVGEHLAYLEKQKEHKSVKHFDLTELIVPAKLPKEQKPAEWSEEDEKPFNDVLSGLKYAYEDLINNKSLDSAKDIKEAFDWMQARVKNFRPQPNQEWNEEDEAKKERLISIVKRALHGNKYPLLNDNGATELITWLKIHPRPQPHTVSIKDATKFGKLEYERGVKDGIQSEKSRHWKPSEEQMKEYSYWYKNFIESGLASPSSKAVTVLGELLEQLQKL